MKYKTERNMYPDVCRWLEDFLKSRFKKANIAVHELSQKSISHFIRTYNQGNFPSEWVTWNIKVDVVGFIHYPNKPTELVFIECKNTTLTLAHLSQLLGYSRIARPLFSFLISTVGFSSTLVSLLKEYHRHDVLEYYWKDGQLPRQLILAQWDKSSLNLNRNTMIGGMGI